MSASGEFRWPPVGIFSWPPSQRLRAGAIAQAAHELVASQQSTMQAKVEALTSDDGLRVWLLWRWRGSRRELIERDADVVRNALAAHPVFADAHPVEARIFRAAKTS